MLKHDGRSRRAAATALPLLVTLLLVAGCGSDDDGAGGAGGADGTTTLDSLGEIVTTRHDGEADGLLGGFGLSGLIDPPESFFPDPQAPSVAELRRRAIHANYTALIDVGAGGGFGTLYGPADDTLYPGTEYQAFVGDGLNRAALMVQVPDSLDTQAPCIVVSPTSGSRGIYGSVGTGGAFALENGCVAAYTDANKGTGAVALTSRTGYSLQLEPIDLNADLNADLDTDLDAEPSRATFRIPTTGSADADRPGFSGATLPDEAAVDSYAETFPNRFAFKHAHSQQNIEKDWGLHTVQAVEFAFRLLNDNHGGPFTRENTLVIGASVSNGGSAVLRAVEQADAGLFDGIVVGEPNINPAAPPTPVTIAMGEREPVTGAGVPAANYFIVAELYAACASKAPATSGALFAELRGDTQARCDALVAAGLLDGDTPQAQGQDALRRLQQAGYLPESNRLLVGYAGIDLFQSLLATYVNAYTRSSVMDRLCEISMAYVDLAGGEVRPSAHPALPTLAATSSGIPRTADVYLIKDDAPGGPTVQLFATSNATSSADYNLEGALCWRDIIENPDNPLHERLQQGVAEILGTGALQGVPSIMVHGRADALIPVNHSSRPYYALNKQIDGGDSPLRYYEVENAQHLDALNAGYASAGMNFVPIDYYFKQGLELMLDHLRTGTALPPSQVVPARAPVDGMVRAEDLVPIATVPEKPIDYADGVLIVPE